MLFTVSSAQSPVVLRLELVLRALRVPTLYRSKLWYEVPKCSDQPILSYFHLEIRQSLWRGRFPASEQNGVTLTNDRHCHANTKTIVGHATLATRTDPAIHGLVAKLWFNRFIRTWVPWVYDTHVLLMIAGPGIDKRSVSRRVEPIDAAPTIGAILGTGIPSGAIGSALTEAIAH
ncbi:MAG: hypothetical protein ACR2PF_15770 [Rhizobiaceae bacterium]